MATCRALCIIISLALLSCSVKSVAQSRYNIQYITTENGLPSDGIKGLQWDENTGFLWIATELGLVRYNGNSFLIFNKENVPFLKSEKIFPLSKDLKGNLFAVNSGTIFEVLPNKLTRAPRFYSEATNRSCGLLQIYIAATIPRKTTVYINDYTDRFLPIDSTRCLIHSHDTLWLFTSQNLKKKMIIPWSQNNSSFVIGKNTFGYDNHETFWIYDTLTHLLKPITISDNNIPEERLPKGKKNLYWEAGMEYPIILAGTNAWTLQYKEGKIIPTCICTEIPRNSSIKFVQYWEKGNILFLGTGSKGILVVRKNYLKNVKKNKSGFDEPNAIYSQILLSNGNVLANTGDILGPSQEPAKVIPIQGPFHNNTFITKDSILWYTNNDSLYYYSYKTNDRKYFSHIAGSLYLAFAVTNNKLYIANEDGICEVLNDSLHFILHSRELGDPFDMAELQPGILALATAKGLFKYNTATGVFDTVFKKGIPVRALWRHKSYLFVGTYGDGIYIWKDDLIKKIPLDNDNYLLYTHCFILDTGGYCWMSTNRGLFKASLNDMLYAFENNTPYVYYHFFGTNEGMDITEMNGGCTPCGIKLQNDNISFPTMDGALWVDPAMPIRFPEGNVFIDQILTNGRKADSGSSNELLFDAGTHDISFYLGFSEWCDKENVYLQYYLNARSTQWQKLDVAHPLIHLSNLPPGKYELYIRELKGFGTENYSLKKISFEILAPWYLKWWGETFLIFLFLLFITIISIAANRRSLMQQRRLKNQLDKKTMEILAQNEKLEKNDRIKTRLISIISHDIITPLKYLHLTSKYLADKKASLPENLRNETLEEVVNTSRELELLSTNILNWIKYQNEERRIVKEPINLHDLLEQVFIILKSLANKNNIELINNIPPDKTVVQFVDPIRIILYNLTVNSINFTKEGSITISCKDISENIEIEVRDTGLGMPISQIKNIISDHVIISSANINKRSGHGLGYLIIKDLLKMIDGQFYIESKVNVGTSVYIIFPVK